MSSVVLLGDDLSKILLLLFAVFVLVLAAVVIAVILVVVVVVVVVLIISLRCGHTPSVSYMRQKSHFVSPKVVSITQYIIH